MLPNLKALPPKDDLLLLLPVLLYFILLLLLTPRYFHGDVGFWLNWAEYADKNGITRIYDSSANYPPVYLYVLNAFVGFFDNFKDAAEQINRVKWITLIFDFLPVFIMFFAGMRDQMRKNLHWYLLFNYAYLCNTLTWGQVDAIHTNLCLLSLVLAIRFPVAAMAVFMIALNTKIQSIIFLPILGILFWPHIGKPRTVMKILSIAMVTELLIIFPFIMAGEVKGYFQVFTSSVGAYPVVSLNAFNGWHLLLSGNLMRTSDDLEFMFLSYRNWGLLTFFISSTVILLPLFLRVRKSGMTWLADDRGQGLLFLCAGLVTLSFFYFNTQMHERYSHAAMIFFFFYALKSKNFFPYILVSIPYFLSMEKLLRFFKISHSSFIFEPKIIAALYLFGLIWAFRNLFADYPYSEIKSLSRP